MLTKYLVLTRLAVIMVAAAGAANSVAVLHGDRPPAGQPERQSLIDNRVPEVIRRLLSDQLGVEGNKIKWESRFIEDLGADDLDCIELTMAIEEEFKIEITNKEDATLKRVSDVVEYLRKRKVLK